MVTFLRPWPLLSPPLGQVLRPCPWIQKLLRPRDLVENRPSGPARPARRLSFGVAMFALTIGEVKTLIYCLIRL